MAKKFLIFLIFAFFFISGANSEGENTMKITSPDFKDNSMIPQRFSCQGEAVNPALLIENIPGDAKSLALIVDDPDAPLKTYVHWVVYDIPVTGKIGENSIPGTQGTNTSGDINYVSPCPPTGTHRYFFKIYALDKMLGLDDGINKEGLEKAMQGHILDKAQLIGLYKKK